MKTLPVHPQPHISSQVCCVCKWRSPRPLVEVWSGGNWHPICRVCLDDVDMGVFGCWSSGRDIPVCDGQLSLL